MIIPLSSRRMLEWLSMRMGSPPVMGSPVLSYEVMVDARKAEEVAARSEVSVFTSPTAVEIASRLLRRSLLSRLLSRSIAIGPLTATEMEMVASGSGLSSNVQIASPNNSSGIIHMLIDGPVYTLWCSSKVNRKLEERIRELAGAVVKAYRITMDAHGLKEAARLLGAPDDRKLAVFTSESSIDAWRIIREHVPRGVMAAAISGRVAGRLTVDDKIVELNVFTGTDIRGFPGFLRGVYNSE